MRRILGAVACLLCLGCLTTSPASLPAFEALPEQAPLPDPFLMMDGTRVTTAKQWNEKRRPELKRLFQHYMYGYAPEPVSIASKLESRETEILGGTAVLRQFEISYPSLPDNAPKIHLAVFLPKGATSVPIFIGMNKCGNQTVLADLAIRINREAYIHGSCPGPPESIRGKDTDFCASHISSSAVMDLPRSMRATSIRIWTIFPMASIRSFPI